MNKAKIAQLLETTEDKISKALQAMGVDHKAEDFTTAQVTDVEMVLRWVAEGATFKDAQKQYEQQAKAQDPLATLTPKEREQIESALDAIADNSSEEFTQVLRTRRDDVIRALLMRFDRRLVGNIVNVVQAPEFKESFAQSFSGQTIDVLPGKPAASLPSSKAGSTSS